MRLRRSLPRPGLLDSAALATLALTTLVAVSGCGVSADSQASDDPTDRAPSSPASASSTPRPTVTATATATATVTASPSASAPGDGTPPTLPDALLGTTELPRLLPDSPWTGHVDRTPGQRPFGPCQKFDLTTIGASGLAQRDYSAADHVAAGEQVADFVDATNALRASRVLASWRQGCAGRVPGAAGVKVSALHPVSVPGGTGAWYLVGYTGLESGTGHATATGWAVRDGRVALLTMDRDGTTGTPDPASDPASDSMAAAVVAAAAKLG